MVEIDRVKEVSNGKKSRDRDWNFCDQCMFYIACLRPERKRGQGCEAYESYPYERVGKRDDMED